MAQQIINVGAAPNDGTGDPLQTAFTKSNANFTELYAGGGGGGGASNLTPPQGRLTLQTGVPVMTATQSAKTTIFYTPYVGNQIPIYNGTSMTMTAFAELSVATTDATKSPAAIGASKVNDWFVWNDAGTIRIGHGPDWTNDTTRSAGTALVMVNGTLLNNAAITNGPASQRGTYVGTTRSNASSQIDWIYGGIAAGGTASFFGVWNAYNRRQVVAFVGSSTDSWTYSTATWRAAEGSATFRHQFVVGMVEDGFSSENSAQTYGDGSTRVYVGIGMNSTTAFTGSTSFLGLGNALPMMAFCKSYPALGFNFVSAIELSSSGVATYYGDDNAPSRTQLGLAFNMDM